jgi:hypothetical protein
MAILTMAQGGGGNPLQAIMNADRAVGQGQQGNHGDTDDGQRDHDL